MNRKIKDLINILIDIEKDRKLIFDKMIQISNIEKDDIILDVGCGIGSMIQRIIKISRYWETIFAVEIEKEVLKYCKKKIKEKSIRKPVIFVAANTLNLPFSDDCFNIVFCGGLLHEVAGLGKKSILDALREIRRVTKKNGKIVAYDLVKPNTSKYLNFNPKNELATDCLKWLLTSDVGKDITKDIINDEKPRKKDKLHISLLYEILWRTFNDYFERAEERHFFFSIDKLVLYMHKAGISEVKVVDCKLDNYQRKGLARRLELIGQKYDERYLFPHRAILVGR